MLLVLCVDLDDDLGRKTGVETPVIGRDAVESAAVALAETDPEDSDVNVLFEGIHIYDSVDDEAVEVAAVTGVDGNDVAANRAVGEEVDKVLASLSSSEDVRALLVTDGPGRVGRPRHPLTHPHRRRPPRRRPPVPGTGVDVLHHQAGAGRPRNARDHPRPPRHPLAHLSAGYPRRQPGTPRVLARHHLRPFGLYILARGLGAEQTLDATVERVRSGLFGGRVTLITYVVAAALLVIGGVSGVQTLNQLADKSSVLDVLAALVYGSIQWFAAAGVTSSLGHVTDEYLDGRFEWRFLNAPFYVLAIAVVLHGVVAYFLLDAVGISYLAITLTGGTLLGVGEHAGVCHRGDPVRACGTCLEELFSGISLGTRINL